MVQQEFTFLSSDGQTQLHAVDWRPEGGVRAVLQISHGVSEHIGRYQPFAAFLTSHGFAVAGHDHLGHGRSVPSGGAGLYFGGKGSWFQVVQDLDTRRSLARQRYPGVPYFMLGHSMGSFLLRTYLITCPGSTDGAIIMGTGQVGSALTAAGRLAAAEERLRTGDDRPSALIQQLAFGAYNRPLSPNRTGFDWLSAAPGNVDAYLADPLCGGSVTPGLFREMMRGLAFIRRPRNLRRMNRNTPILFVSGADDPVGGYGRGVRAAYESFQRAGMRRVSMRLYPGWRHEILNEDGKERLYRDLLQWLEAQIGQTA